MGAEAIQDVYSTWLALDAHIASLEDTGADTLPSRSINDCCYFVMLFAQLEDAINSAFAESVGPWECEPFGSRLQMMAEALGGEDVAQAIGRHYLIRCEIAHGRLLEHLPIHIPSAVETYVAAAARLA